MICQSFVCKNSFEKIKHKNKCVYIPVLLMRFRNREFWQECYIKHSDLNCFIQPY